MSFSQFIYRWNGSICNLKIEKDEIDEVKWVSIKDVYEAISDAQNHDWAKASAIYAIKFMKEFFPEYL